MSIFIDRNTRVLVQGITGKEGAFWTGHMRELGTNVVAGVTPGKEGQDVDGVAGIYRRVGEQFWAAIDEGLTPGLRVEQEK